MEKFLNLEGLKHFKDKIKTDAPYIGENQNWYVNGEDTGISAKGIEGIGSLLEYVPISFRNYIFYGSRKYF